MNLAITAGEFQVQVRGLKGEWKTVCTNANLSYVKLVFEKQVKHGCVGKFRVVDPNGNQIMYQEKSLFS